MSAPGEHATADRAIAWALDQALAANWATNVVRVDRNLVDAFTAALLDLGVDDDALTEAIATPQVRHVLDLNGVPMP